MIDTEDRDYLEELIYKDEIISFFSALIKPLQESSFPCAEDLFHQVSLEIVNSSSAINHIYLAIPCSADEHYRLISNETIPNKEALKFKDELAVNQYFKDHFEAISPETAKLEISDAIKTNNSKKLVEKAYLTYFSSNTKNSTERQLTSYDTIVIDALIQLIKFTEKNNRDRMTGLLRRDVAEARILNIIKSINSQPFQITINKDDDEREIDQYNQLSIMFVDIDYFKKINDFHGHDAGDICINSVGQILKHKVKRQIQGSKDFGDIVARWGGEEFLIVLHQCDTASAYKIAQKIRCEAENTEVLYDNKQNRKQKITFTLSIGIISLDLQNNSIRTSFNLKDFDKLIDMADDNLYAAKQAGRNKVIPSTITYEELISSKANGKTTDD